MPNSTVSSTTVSPTTVGATVIDVRALSTSEISVALAEPEHFVRTATQYYAAYRLQSLSTGNNLTDDDFDEFVRENPRADFCARYDFGFSAYFKETEFN